MKKVSVNSLVCFHCLERELKENQLEIFYCIIRMIMDDISLNEYLKVREPSIILRKILKQFFIGSVDISLLNYMRDTFDSAKYELSFSRNEFFEDFKGRCSFNPDLN